MSVMRRALLSASQSIWLRERAPRYGFMRRTVERFMPGEDAQDALAAAQTLAKNRISSVLTQLGENITDRGEAEAVTHHYAGVINRIRTLDLPVEISVKLTQLGLDLDHECCYDNLEKLIEQTPPGKILWIDMERSPYIDPTLEIYRRARRVHANVGVCLQAYLYRTERDLDGLIALAGSVRLVKGAYNEPSEIAYPRKKDVDENYFHLAQRLLCPEARRSRVRAALATHDRALIARIAEWTGAQGISKDHIEFQMLFGIQPSEQLRLAQEGYRVGVLISYGKYWFPWFMRRLAERPANVLFLARNFFSR